MTKTLNQHEIISVPEELRDTDKLSVQNLEGTPKSRPEYTPLFSDHLFTHETSLLTGIPAQQYSISPAAAGVQPYRPHQLTTWPLRQNN